jgi:exopolyphosphatase/guanosine-5'-triphosphate,3'-diphosphate pyrophosphatase
VEQRVLDHAGQWGAAIRLAQRLSGGTEKLLERCRIALEENEVVLRLAKKDARLYSDIVARRHRQLANLMGLTARVELG